MGLQVHLDPGRQSIWTRITCDWTTKPGLYRCVVHHDMLQEQCSSHLIQVTLPEADVLVCNCVGTKHYVMGICTFLSLGVITPLADPQTHASTVYRQAPLGVYLQASKHHKKTFQQHPVIYLFGHRELQEGLLSVVFF